MTPRHQPVPHETREPFGVRLDKLRRDERLTFRALADRLNEDAASGERPFSYGYLVNLTKGRCRPTPEVITAVARAFDGIERESFAEWQMWRAQMLLDPSGPGGFDGALAELDAFESVRPHSEWPDASPAPRGRRHVRTAA
jgi:transcriptional regulator with XRE-family HTH domain